MTQFIYNTADNISDLQTILDKEDSLFQEGINIDELRKVLIHILTNDRFKSNFDVRITQVIPHNYLVGNKHYLILWEIIQKNQ